jgi:hypothetical protein
MDDTGLNYVNQNTGIRMDRAPMILLTFKYIDSDKIASKNHRTSSNSKIQLALPKELLLHDSHAYADKTMNQQQQEPIPQYTTSLIEQNTAIAIHLLCKSTDDDVYSYSERYLPSCLGQWNDNHVNTSAVTHPEY